MAHPLLDRRDLTASRQAVPAPASGPDLGGVLGELAEMNRLLRALLQQDTAHIAQLCVTDREPPQAVMHDWPVPGVRRMIVRRTGAGGLFTLAANAPVQVLQANENRLGGQIVNSGANPVTLFLSVDLLQPGSASPLPEGAAQVVLIGGGGAWDMRLSRTMWCGNVIAVSALGSSVSVAEI